MRSSSVRWFVFSSRGLASLDELASSAALAIEHSGSLLPIVQRRLGVADASGFWGGLATAFSSLFLNGTPFPLERPVAWRNRARFAVKRESDLANGWHGVLAAFKPLCLLRLFRSLMRESGFEDFVESGVASASGTASVLTSSLKGANPNERYRRRNLI